MKTIFYPEKQRGVTNIGWLYSKYSFSFGQFYNPSLTHFGTLRVLNDDTIKGGTGFGTHPHDNMEIISIPLVGALKHEDSMGNKITIDTDDVQVMSAGSGITHSEYNASETKEAKFLQIWILPSVKNIEPRYDQKNIKNLKTNDTLFPVFTPHKDDDTIWINQEAWGFMGDFDTDQQTPFSYTLNKKQNGVYVFILEGEATIGDKTLHKRDALGVYDTDAIPFGNIHQGTKMLLMEVPMSN